MLSPLSLSLIIAFFIGHLLFRLLMRRRVKTLTPEQKLRIIDAFHGYHQVTTLVMLALIVLVALPLFVHSLPLALNLAGFAGIVVASIVMSAIAQVKLRRLDLPADYLRLATVQSISQLTLLAAFAISVAVSVV